MSIRNHWRHLKDASSGHLGPLSKAITTFILVYSSSSSSFSSLMAFASSPSPSLPSSSLSSPSSLPSSPSSLQSHPPDPSSSQEALHAQLAESLETAHREQLVYGIAYALIIVLSLLGNVLVVKVTLSNLTKTNTLILSLATSDLLMSTFNIPFNYFRLLNHSWTFGSTMCFLVNFLKNTAVYNSSYTMALIAIQRYYSIVVSSQGSGTGNACLKRLFTVTGSRNRNSGGDRNSHLKTIITTVLVLWIASATISTLFTYPSRVVSRQNIYGALYQHLARLDNRTAERLGLPADYQPPLTMYRCTNPLPRGVERAARKLGLKSADLIFSLVVFVTQYFIPLSIACALYVRIGKTIAYQGRLASLKQNSKAQLREAKKRRRILMLVLVVAAFALCWAPIHIFHLLVDAAAIGYHYQAFMVVHWLAMSSVIYNPFIYCWLNESFRKTAVRVFCICCPSRMNFMKRSSTANSRNSTSTTLPPAKSLTAKENPSSIFEPSSNLNLNNNNNKILTATAANNDINLTGNPQKNESNLSESTKADSASAAAAAATEVMAVANGGVPPQLSSSCCSSLAELDQKRNSSSTCPKMTTVKGDEKLRCGGGNGGRQLAYNNESGNRVESLSVQKAENDVSSNGSNAVRAAANHIETHL